MINYCLYIAYFMLMQGTIIQALDEQPPYISIINILEPFIGDEKCAQQAKNAIYKEFEGLVTEQKDKAARIQNILKPYESIKEGSATANLFNDWLKLEEQKNKLVGNKLKELLNCSSVFRAGQKIAAVPGQIAESAQQAADRTKKAASAAKAAAINAGQQAANAAKTGAMIAVGVPVVAGQAAYQAGKKAVNTTVNAAQEAKRTVEKKIDETTDAIVQTKDSYIDRLIQWFARLKSDKSTQKK